MRRLVTGVDGRGRSCLVETSELSVADGEQRPPQMSTTLFETSQTPPPVRPEGNGGFVDLGVAPGLVQWMVVQFPPGTTTPFHHTDTIDLDTVLEGSVQLVLDDGAHELGPGDCVVVPGVDHAWTVGSDGCRMSICCIGTPPPT